MMKNISEYDQRQLRLMLNSLIDFEKKQIALHSLIANLEFLLNAMELVEGEWEEKFLKEITALESMNAIFIIKAANEEAPEINREKAEDVITKAISNLKALIEKEIIAE